MILDNITRALKAQNWVAVAIELLIVIAGVVIGFQVNAWNEERVRNAQAVTMTERLLVDIRSEHWRVAGAAVYYEQVYKNAARTIEALQSGTDVDDKTLVIGAFRAAQSFGFPIIRATYEELVANGAINLISDEKLRRLTIEYYETDPYTLTYQDVSRPYRHAFLRMIDLELYQEMRATCAEPMDLEIGNYDRIYGLLTGLCELNGQDDEVSALATRLRASPKIIGLLRQRANETLIESGNNSYWRGRLEAIGVNPDAAP